MLKAGIRSGINAAVAAALIVIILVFVHDRQFETLIHNLTHWQSQFIGGRVSVNCSQFWKYLNAN